MSSGSNHLTGNELDICGQGIELQGFDVAANGGAELLARAGACFRPDTFELHRDIVGLPCPVEEAPESLPLHQPAGADGNGRSDSSLWAARGCSSEELLEIVALIARPYRVRYRAMDFVETAGARMLA
jgi:hypothetical protein